MSMGLLRLLSRRAGSAPVARERLQILLAHERGQRGQPDLLGLLREEILAVVSKHVKLDPDKVLVKWTAAKAFRRWKSTSNCRTDLTSWSGPGCRIINWSSVQTSAPPRSREPGADPIAARALARVALKYSSRSR